MPRSGPADQAPTVTRRAVRGHRLSSAGLPSIVLPPSLAGCAVCPNEVRLSGSSCGGKHSGDVDADAGAHGAGDRERPEVRPFRAGGLGAVDGIDERGEVGDQRVGVEARLADRDMDDGALVDLELDAPALDLADRSIQVEGYRAGLGVRHEA